MGAAAVIMQTAPVFILKRAGIAYYWAWNEVL
jgi:hypothetical protein